MTRDPNNPTINVEADRSCGAPLCVAPPEVEPVADERMGICMWCMTELERIEAEAADQVRDLGA